MFPVEVGSDGDSLSGGAAAAIAIFVLLVIAIAVGTGIIIILFYHYKQKPQENQVNNFGKAGYTQYTCSFYFYYFFADNNVYILQPVNRVAETNHSLPAANTRNINSLTSHYECDPAIVAGGHKSELGNSTAQQIPVESHSSSAQSHNIDKQNNKAARVAAYSEVNIVAHSVSANFIKYEYNPSILIVYDII